MNRRRCVTVFVTMIGALLTTAMGAESKSQTRPLTIVTLGDSITKGVRRGVETEQTFAALIERSLGEQGISCRVVNEGIGEHPNVRLEQYVETCRAIDRRHGPSYSEAQEMAARLTSLCKRC